MIDYNEFINKLKQYEDKADFELMQTRIEGRISREKTRTRLTLAGALAVTLLAAAAYFYSPSPLAGNGDFLMSYVFEPESADGALMDYVFSHGTFSE